MRVFFVILVCKLLHFIGKLIGKGSSLPGKYALKLDRNILKKIKMPEYIIAVTGSNGKTSTVEMIAHILQEGGKTVAYNKEGSNQIEGVTTFILCNSTMGGKVKSDILLIESDERFAQYTFKYFKPTHYVITNLYRDQLTRNGHPEWVYDCLKNSIHDGTQLILNADDPLVSCFGYGKMMLYTLVRIRFPFLTRKITAYIMTEFSVHTAKSVFLMNIIIIIILENILALIADLKEIIHSSLLLPQTLIRAR